MQSGISLPKPMELAYEMVLRHAHLAPEKLSFVAGRIEQQASRPIEEAPRVKNVTKNATFSLRSVHCTLSLRPERFELPTSWFVVATMI